MTGKGAGHVGPLKLENDYPRHLIPAVKNSSFQQSIIQWLLQFRCVKDQRAFPRNYMHSQDAENPRVS